MMSNSSNRSNKLNEPEDKALDDLMYGLTPETRLLNDVCLAATKEQGRFTSFKMENVGDGWKRIEFYWKPKDLSEVELEFNP